MGVTGEASVEGKQHVCWSDLPAERVMAGVTRQRVDAQHMTVLRYRYEPGAHFPAHSHPEEQVVLVLSGEIEFMVANRPVSAAAGSMLVIPPQTVHSARVLGDTPADTINVLSPRRTKEVAFTASGVGRHSC
jgi:quercetin dioxygenase-like cupin family protein